MPCYCIVFESMWLYEFLSRLYVYERHREMHITSFLALSFAIWTVSPVLCEVQDLTCEELASKMAPEIERLGLPHDGLEAGGKPTN